MYPWLIHLFSSFNACSSECIGIGLLCCWIVCAPSFNLIFTDRFFLSPDCCEKSPLIHFVFYSLFFFVFPFCPVLCWGFVLRRYMILDFNFSSCIQPISFKGHVCAFVIKNGNSSASLLVQTDAVVCPVNSIFWLFTSF